MAIKFNWIKVRHDVCLVFLAGFEWTPRQIVERVAVANGISLGGRQAHRCQSGEPLFDNRLR